MAAFAKSKRHERTWFASSYRKSVHVTEAECRKQELGSLRSDAQKTSGGHITKEQDRNEKLEF